MCKTAGDCVGQRCQTPLSCHKGPLQEQSTAEPPLHSYENISRKQNHSIYNSSIVLLGTYLNIDNYLFCYFLNFTGTCNGKALSCHAPSTRKKLITFWHEHNLKIISLNISCLNTTSSSWNARGQSQNFVHATQHSTDWATFLTFLSFPKHFFKRFLFCFVFWAGFLCVVLANLELCRPGGPWTHRDPHASVSKCWD